MTKTTRHLWLCQTSENVQFPRNKEVAVHKIIYSILKPVEFLFCTSENENISIFSRGLDYLHPLMTDNGCGCQSITIQSPDMWTVEWRKIAYRNVKLEKKRLIGEVLLNVQIFTDGFSFSDENENNSNCQR